MKAIAERSDILPQLAEVFRAHGYEGATLALIGEATSLGKGSLYHFFPGGKSQMAAEVLAEIDRWFEDNIFTPLQAADDPASTGRLCLLSPTWRGLLPTMTGRRMALFRGLSKMVDLPGIGRGFYRLNVNGPVIGMMARGHVYADPAWLTPARMAAKRAVTDAPGARYASFRFVAGEVDPFTDRNDFLEAASRAGAILSLYGRKAPRKTKAEIEALGSLPNVTAVELPHGKLNFYEEFPDETVSAINEKLGAVED